jgi:hypothetical protein
MMNPDEAQRAFRKWAPKWDPGAAEAFAAGHFDTSASGVCFSEGYRAGASASEARIKALKEALQRLVTASDCVEEYTHEIGVELEEAIEAAESVLKEVDQ